MICVVSRFVLGRTLLLILLSRGRPRVASLFFFFNDTATTEIYTSFPTRRSSDLPISRCGSAPLFFAQFSLRQRPCILYCPFLVGVARSEEHTSELQSHSDLVCRLLLEKKKKKEKKDENRKKTASYTELTEGDDATCVRIM